MDNVISIVSYLRSKRMFLLSFKYESLNERVSRIENSTEGINRLIKDLKLNDNQCS